MARGLSCNAIPWPSKIKYTMTFPNNFFIWKTYLLLFTHLREGVCPSLGFQYELLTPLELRERLIFEMQGMCMFHGMKIFTDVASFTFLVKHESDSDWSLKIDPHIWSLKIDPQPINWTPYLVVSPIIVQVCVPEPGSHPLCAVAHRH